MHINNCTVHGSMGSGFLMDAEGGAQEEVAVIEEHTIREQLAALAHEQWSGWMEYLFSKGTFNPDGTWTMPPWAVERWQRQANTPYAELSEQEKDSDRNEADRFLKVFQQSLEG